MGFVQWFKTTTFHGKLIRDVGKVKVSGGLGSVSFTLQELRASLHTGERQYLLTIAQWAMLRYHARALKLTQSQLQALNDLLQNGLAQHSNADPSAGLAPTSFS